MQNCDDVCNVLKNFHGTSLQFKSFPSLSFYLMAQYFYIWLMGARKRHKKAIHLWKTQLGQCWESESSKLCMPLREHRCQQWRRQRNWVLCNRSYSKKYTTKRMFFEWALSLGIIKLKGSEVYKNRRRKFFHIT